MNEEVIDTYTEHPLHDKYDPSCSECWSENLRLKQATKQEYFRKLREELGYDNRSALEPRDGSTPWDRNPLE